MSLVTPQRTTRRRRLGAAAVVGTVVAACASAVLPTVAHGASIFGSTFTGYSIAGVASQTVRVPADLEKQVIVLTGTNFSEDNIASIDLGPGCLGVVTYVVVNATTISVKTPSSAGCAATLAPAAASGGDSVTINEVGNVAALTKTGLYFVAPPDVATTNPVITETSSNLTSGDQVKTLLPGGGQLIRVSAASDFAFDGKLTSTNALTASLGGKALTGITVYIAATGVAQGTGGTADVGNWFTAVTPVLVAGGSYPLVISQGGVSRSFSAVVTGLSWPAVPTVTSVATTAGIAGKSGATLKITGTNFSSAADIAVTICGATATPTTPTSTSTIIYVTAPVVAKTAVPAGLGAAVLDGPCAVRVTNVTAALTSPITSGAYYMYVINEAP